MTFKLGDVANPEGRRAEDRKLKLLCRQFTDRAVSTLVKYLDAENPMVAVAAAKELLDRAYGKSKQVVEGKFEHDHTVSTGDEIGIAERVERAKKARSELTVQ